MSPIRKVLVGGAIAGAALLGGAIGASFLGTAGAQTSPTPSTTAPASAPTNQPGSHGAPDWSKGGHQANGKTEAVLSGDQASSAIAAAQAAVPGATAQRAETDAEGAAYEVHMTKPDGSVVTVKLDSNFKVTETVNGMG